MDNEEYNISPDAHASEPELESFEETKPSNKKLGPIIVVGIAVVCLIVVLFVIFLRLTAPKSAPAPIVEPPVVEEAAEPAVDPTIVPGRDPEILGLRIDTRIGRLFVLPDSGQALYATAEDCTGDCLDIWTPYEAVEAIEEEGMLGTVERGGGSLQYTWNGKALYTFNQDDERSVLGDGYGGVWNIARP